MNLCAIHSQWYVEACPMCSKNNNYEVPFDSFYEHGWETGVQAEQQRIIKLLEEHTYYGQDGCLEFSDKALTRSDLEALIKANK